MAMPKSARWRIFSLSSIGSMPAVPAILPSTNAAISMSFFAFAARLQKFCFLLDGERIFLRIGQKTVRFCMQKLRSFGQNMAELGGQQSLSCYAEPTCGLASGKQVYFPFIGNSVLLNGLCGELHRLHPSGQLESPTFSARCPFAFRPVPCRHRRRRVPDSALQPRHSP